MGPLVKLETICSDIAGAEITKMSRKIDEALKAEIALEACASRRRLAIWRGAIRFIPIRVLIARLRRPVSGGGKALERSAARQWRGAG